MKLTFKTGVTLVAILVFAVLVTGLLNYYKYQSTLSELIHSRLVVVGLDLKQSIEGSVGLGIPLNQTQNIQEIIDRTRNEDDQVLSVEVFEMTADGGTKLFHTDRDGVGKSVPQSWLTASGDVEEPVWSVDTKDATVTGFSLVNNFNKVIGAVVLRYSKSYQQAKTADMFKKLARTGAVVLGAAGILAFFGVFLMFRKISSSFTRMTESLNALIAGKTPTLTDETATTEEELHFVRFQKKTGDLLDLMSDAERITPLTAKEK
jgi:hypothetical protein